MIIADFPEVVSGLVHAGTQSSVPCSFQFLELINRMLTRERNDCVPVLFCVQTGTQSSAPCSFQFLELINRMLTRERNDCVLVLFCVQTGTQSFRCHVFHLPVQMGTEWNVCVSSHFWYHFFNRSIFWNGTVLFEVFLT